MNHEIDIHAPIEACFNLAHDIGFHVRSMERTNERAIAGRTEGLIELGETVTWQANHLGLTRRMAVRITAMDRPTHFRDEQTDGPFKHFVHDHFFEDLGESITRMRDVVAFSSPFGLIGKCVDSVYLSHYIKRLIETRSHCIKVELESANA